MLNGIGIVGFGFVGKAVYEVFKHNAKIHIIDPKNRTSSDYMTVVREHVDAIFVCVPAPTLENGIVDTSIICSVLEQISRLTYQGIVVIKSTVPPNLIEEIFKKFSADEGGELNLVYSPEFLKENTWSDDAVEPEMIIIGGNYILCEEIQRIYSRHGFLVSRPRYFITTPGEAALAKYTINTFLAMKITFFNQIYQYLTDIDGKSPELIWENFTKMVSTDSRIGESHMMVPGPDGKFGYGGSCFPKDVKGFIGADSAGRLSLLRETDIANTKIRLTDKAKDSNNN